MSNKASMFHSIRTKFLFLILFFVAVLMFSVLGLINSLVGAIVLEESLAKGLAVARGVAAASADPLLTNDDLTLFTNIKGVTEDKGILYGMVAGKDGRIKAHSDVAQSGKEYAEPAGASSMKEGADYRIKTYARGAEVIYDISVPIKSVRLPEGFGYVHIGMSRAFIDQATKKVDSYIKYLTVFGLFLGGLGALLITSIVIKPVRILEKSAREIGSGNLDYRIDVKRKDELGTLMNAFNDMALGLSQKQFIKESFGRYVAPEVVDMILHNRETWFKGKKMQVTILFADIRGFTSLSEKKDPEAVITLLNEYFTLVTGIIQKHRGYIDKFIGDAIMAVFGSPVEYEDHALSAARAACEMLEKLKRFNEGRPDRVDIGIGINSGEVVAGNLGSIQKMEYAVIGDNVNTASRLCSVAKKGEVIISGSTFERLKENRFECVSLSPVSVKGKSEPVKIYSLIPRRSAERPDDDSKGRLMRAAKPEPGALVEVIKATSANQN